MMWFAAAPFAVAALLALLAEPLARRMTPNVSVRLLTGLSLSVSLCTGLVLSAAAVLMCAQFGPLPRIGRWSAHTLQNRMGFPIAAGVAALLVVLWFLTAAIVRAAWVLRLLFQVNRSINLLEPVAGNLVVIDDDAPTAYSVAGLRGRIVVSTSLLAALSSDERRVLIAHETSHLHHRHDLYLHVADIAAAANPLLRPAARTIRRGIERWADEDAATSVGDRVLVARSLAKAALATTEWTVQRPRLAIADDRVAERIDLLLRPAPARSRLSIIVILTAGLFSWIAAATVTTWANNVVQAAEAAYQRH
jgi:beta-lactamase regulating signal transducer with metallopeptidase domain